MDNIIFDESVIVYFNQINFIDKSLKLAKSGKNLKRSSTCLILAVNRFNFVSNHNKIISIAIITNFQVAIFHSVK